MFRIFFLLVLFLGLKAGAAPAPETVLNQCNVYPEIKTNMIRYLNNGPAMYGVWYFDLDYKVVQTVLFTDSSGNPVCEKPVTRSYIVEGPHFELNEQFGKAVNVVRDVRAYIAGHDLEKCK